MNFAHTPTSAVDADTLGQIDALGIRYIRALDAKDMGGWADCFADPGSYICTSRENEEQNLPLALMMDNSRARIADRVKYVKEVWAGTFEDYNTRHFLQRVACAAGDGRVFLVESNFMLAYTTARGHSDLLVAGVYHDEVEITAQGARFRLRRAVLDTITTPRYLVYPV
jgi:anthranilate 1,2-dioxygenase small subunit